MAATRKLIPEITKPTEIISIHREFQMSGKWEYTLVIKSDNRFFTIKVNEQPGIETLYKNLAS